ncbi:MAG: hypothetical protein F6J98_17885 [Moorea sp. SIO4G2]|nr:hypothetical protein [Moorena sp. SIO4G2]
MANRPRYANNLPDTERQGRTTCDRINKARLRTITQVKLAGNLNNAQTQINLDCFPINHWNCQCCFVGFS